MDYDNLNEEKNTAIDATIRNILADFLLNIGESLEGPIINPIETLKFYLARMVKTENDMKLLIDELKNCKEDRERWKVRTDDIRNDLNNCRADGRRLRRMSIVLTKTNVEFAQKLLLSKGQITTLFQEKFINKLLLQRRDRQIRE